MSNCREMLSERLQVQWEAHEDRVQVQLSAIIRIDQYIAFGISGEHKRYEDIKIIKNSKNYTLNEIKIFYFTSIFSILKLDAENEKLKRKYFKFFFYTKTI